MKTDLQRLYRLNELPDGPPAVSHRFEFPAELARELLRLANNSDLSLYVIFEAALKVLRHEYTSPSFKTHLLEVRKRVLQARTCDDRPLELKVGTTDLSFEFTRTGSELRGVIVSTAYDPKGVANYLIHVLKSVARNVDIAIDDITLFLRGPERDTGGKLTHRVFEEQVEKTPDRIAVSYENESLTYSELNAHANRLARALRCRGVKPEVIVPVLMRRSPNLLITMLALFKCGGVYLPLDTHQPAARLTQIISDSKSPLVLATNEFRDSVKTTILFVEDLVAETGSEQNLSDTCHPTNLAYLIYTSGSTGAPKGAMLEHRGMFNHLDAKIVDLELSETDVVAQTASQCFDVSVWQLLAALLTGGQVRIIADEVVKEPSQLLNELTRKSVSVLEVVPSQLRSILTTIDLNGIPDISALRFLLVTGEALPPALCRQWLELFLATPLINAYGPTECSDDVTHHFISNDTPLNSDSTPIGNPIQNMQVYVLDRELLLVPIGVSGEIHVGGIGVGRGYVYDAKRTAEVYLPDPFSKQAGARLYYTGDLGCYLPDGSIQFNGRRDHQVKVRGVRIELGEIEAALRAHPEVNDVVVLALDDRSRLVAYVAGTGVMKKHLRQFVRGKLPEHMVPSEFVILDKLPLNRNGKVDRNSLPRPDLIDRREDEDFLAPSTALEKTLASIWARNLKLTEVSLGDNFFDLGGNSLLAIQVLNQIRSELNINLPMKVLLESATLAELTEESGHLLPAGITDQCQNNVTAFATQR